MYTTNLSLMAMLGGAVVMAASQEGPSLQKDGGELITASFEYGYVQDAGDLGSHMITLNAEFMDGTGVLEVNKNVHVALCFEWLDTSDVKLIKCLMWLWNITSDEEQRMIFNGIESTGASTLDAAAFSGSDNLDSQFTDLVNDGAAYVWTDITDMVLTTDDISLNEALDNWSIIQKDLVGSGSKLTGAIALELVDESELAALRNGGVVPGVMTIYYEDELVSSNVNIEAPEDDEEPEEESAARLSSSLLTLAMLALWTASI